MVDVMSSNLNKEEPATRTDAPASTHCLPVAALMPPSTDISMEGRLESAHFLISDIFGTQSAMKDCPPNPGWTVMTSARSAEGRKGIALDTGVSGFRDIPAFKPLSLILSIAPWMSPLASQWTVMRSHPASAKLSMYLTGSSIIRCASNGISAKPRTALTTGAPNVMFGTNIPSITSRWAQSAPDLSTRAISSPNLEKSADSMDGDTFVIGPPLRCACLKYARNEAVLPAFNYH